MVVRVIIFYDLVILLFFSLWLFCLNNFIGGLFGMLDIYNSDTLINFHRSILNKKMDQTVLTQLADCNFDRLPMSDLVYNLDLSDFDMVVLCELLAPYFLNRYKDAGFPYLANDFNYIISELNDSVVIMFNGRAAIRADVDEAYNNNKCRLVLNSYNVSSVNDIFICSPLGLKHVYAKQPTNEDISSLVDCMLDVFSFIIGEMVDYDCDSYDVINLCCNNAPYGDDLYFWNVLTSVTYAYGNYSNYYHKVLLNVIHLFKSSDVASNPIDVISLLERGGANRQYMEEGRFVRNDMNITYNDVFASFNL